MRRCEREIYTGFFGVFGIIGRKESWILYSFFREKMILMRYFYLLEEP